MRRPSPSDLARLGLLTRVRELTAMAELAKSLAARRAIQSELQELRSRTLSAHSVEDARTLEKWALWREQAIRKHCAELARTYPEHARIAHHCGKAIATNAVLDALHQDVVQKATKAHEKHAEDQQGEVLHFLANNVGDQNI